MRTLTRTTRWPLLRPSATIILALVSFSLLSLGHSLGHSHSIRHHHSPRSLNTPSNPNFEGYSLRATTITTVTGQTGGSSASSDSGDFTCGPGKECSNGACCGDSGWCGYGLTYCGDGCQSNCNAKAACGKDAATANQTCPLNVCCSEFGFCGTTNEFCSGKCQSNCEQPKPSTGASNVQKRIVGYWETWNLDHPCGTMNPSEIPVSMLTHLNIAFGYINHNFQITNMDGILPKMYQNVAAVKSKNPNLKVLIALGGWTFSDPGAWQDVFPTMASTAENRATFIKNALGWLSEYGYDGIDFDWEYPGADDRGGSDGDGENYTALMKELRAAIDASGKEYIITFTAPSSYWYLRHFDITNMMIYVDWVNLMSYDLHGVWDSDNPIGNQVLSHTNLTEIDLALDLFWRNDVEPSKIVLGLGFYGRSFKLSSPSCWKPGCDFSGPGSEGKCTKTAGILSYREITSILEQTGAKPYFDKEAAAKYLVYGGDNWISYDDTESFQLKIDYANKMGLGGLMVWAIDQDDASLTALRAITDPSLANDDSAPFTLVDLHRLFSNEDYPTDDKNPRFGMVNFGNEANLGEASPDKTGFGFFLVVGESHAVSKLRRRVGDPEPFTFLDCPANVTSRPDGEPQVARVVCLNEDVEGCFRVLERGVEGTVVEMPDNCAPGTFARAISLNASDDQRIPSHLESRASSAVFEFTFDYDFNLLRKDTQQTSIRMDYASMPGYWSNLIDSEGVQSTDLKGLQSTDEKRIEDRFFSDLTREWDEQFGGLNFRNGTETNRFDRSLTAAIFWDTVDKCRVDGSQFSEGIGAYVDGSIHARFEYGFTLIATIKDGKLSIRQTRGRLYAEGYTDLTFTVGGVGKLDISRTMNGNPAWYHGEKQRIDAYSVYANGMKGWATYKPYVDVHYMIGTQKNDTFSEVSFSGLLSARVNSSIGPISASFPNIEASASPAGTKIAAPKISIPDANIVYDSSNGTTGVIALACYISLGLDLEFAVTQGLENFPFHGPDINIRFDSTVAFQNDASSGKGTCVDYDIITSETVVINNSGDLDAPWPDKLDTHTVYQTTLTPSGEGTCYVNAAKRSLPFLFEDQPGGEYSTPSKLESASKEDLPTVASEHPKRASSGFPGFGYGAGIPLKPDHIFKGDFGIGAKILQDLEPLVKSQHCVTCEREDYDPCCGCTSMDLVYGYTDMNNCEECNKSDGDWPGDIFDNTRRSIKEGDANDESGVLDDAEDSDDHHSLDKRVYGIASNGFKSINACKLWTRTRGQNDYPSFPSKANHPWDGIENNAWNGISTYWGNSSASCSDWGVTRTVQPDLTPDKNGFMVRANYQTEHPFEGQLIADFFGRWLSTGGIRNQDPVPKTLTPKFSCKLYRAHIFKGAQGAQWGGYSFIDYLLDELGSKNTQDRLSIYLARPNRVKGAIFTGIQPFSEAKFKKMTEEEQILAIKEMGMMFEYMRSPDIWRMFCATYEGIYNKMGEFDEWYAWNVGVATFNLQDEWKDYIRVVLDSAVRRSRNSFATYLKLSWRSSVLLTPHWFKNLVVNRPKMKIEQVCKNMDPTTVRPWIFL